MDDQTVQRNREQQAQWYGEPVGDTVRRITAALGLTQGQLAAVVGLSAPMLSQLASGQRVKIANPGVLSRLQAITALADDPGTLDLSRTEVTRRVAAVRDVDASGVLTTGSAAAGRGPEAAQALLRAVASAAELERAAGLLDAAHPALAQVLRVYGLGRTQEARAHWAAEVEDRS